MKCELAAVCGWGGSNHVSIRPDIFTLVDSLVLQMERYLNLAQGSSAEPEPIGKSTGTVPKARSLTQSQSQSQIQAKPQAWQQAGRAKWAVSGSPSAERDSKLLSQSSKSLTEIRTELESELLSENLPEPQQLNKRRDTPLPVRDTSSQELSLEIDLDCEFGMEHIEKYRANKVRGETRPEPEPERAGRRGDPPGERSDGKGYGGIDKLEGEGDRRQLGEGRDGGHGDRRECGEEGQGQGRGLDMGRGQGQGDGLGLDHGYGYKQEDGAGRGPGSCSGSTITSGSGSGRSSSGYGNQRDRSRGRTPSREDSVNSGE